MKTLIELYDEMPIENVLSSDVFRPETVIFLCPADVAQDKTKQKKLSDFLCRNNSELKIVFLETSQFSTKKIVAQLERIIDEYEDCALDISGGTDNMLFAAGVVAAKRDIAVFTYSYKKNRFYDISNAEFADGVECHNLYSIKDFFSMAGGKMGEGRAAKESLDSHMDLIEPLFKVFLKYKRKWPAIIAWIQQASRNSDLNVYKVSTKQKNDRGKLSDCPRECLKDLESAGLISGLYITDTVSFTFKDEQVRFWLRDVGSALEVFTYKRAIDSGIFNECQCSVIVEWESEDRTKQVYNEIDVMATENMKPCFISCKACQIETYALNELAILRDRFGGKYAQAIIVSSEDCSNRTQARADELGIRVVSLTHLDDQLRYVEDGGSTEKKKKKAISK